MAGLLNHMNAKIDQSIFPPKVDVKKFPRLTTTRNIYDFVLQRFLAMNDVHAGLPELVRLKPDSFTKRNHFHDLHSRWWESILSEFDKRS